MSPTESGEERLDPRTETNEHEDLSSGDFVVGSF